MTQILRVLQQNDVERHLQLALGEAFNAGLEHAAKKAEKVGAHKFAAAIREDMATDNGRRL